jgi:aconitase A
MVAFDATTAEYLRGRPLAPQGAEWEQALHSDEGARFDAEVTLDAAALRPQVTWGTAPEMVVSIDGAVPDPLAEPDPVRREGIMQYMSQQAGTPITAIALDRVFIGSYTNSRIQDLRAAAAAVVQGRSKASHVKQALVVPGSGVVKVQAEAEGLDQIFLAAGFKVVIAPSFADIFFNNRFKNGLLPIILAEAEVDQLFAQVVAAPGWVLTVNLPAQFVQSDDGALRFEFAVDPFRKECLQHGWDDIGLVLRHADRIREFETQGLAAQPWLAPTLA